MSMPFFIDVEFNMSECEFSRLSVFCFLRFLTKEKIIIKKTT